MTLILIIEIIFVALLICGLIIVAKVIKKLLSK